jgi:acetylornithine deacetylase/succinyl-diaminopimelate desuccinylase-like protein
MIRSAMSLRHVLLPIALLLAVPLIHGQDNPAARAALEWRQQHERAIVDEFIDLLRVPNIASDRDNIRRNAELIAQMMQKRGIESRLLTVEGANPVVFGRIDTPGATRTLVFYAHYDGQPLDPADWLTPPFTPTLRSKPAEDGGQVVALPAAGQHFDPESRLYARSSGDDKAPILAMMTALDAIRAAGLSLHSNIKFAFEGEEEAGSPNLERIVAANRDLLAGDLWLMCDGPVHQTRRPLIYFGARDVVTFGITVFGPKNELHSGHYGNWAPNPAMLLAELLASMKDEHGHVLVKGFYDEVEPLGPVEKRALAEAPDVDAQLMQEFWLGSTDAEGRKLVDLITEPSLNVRGLASAHVGAQATNVIPATATAAMDIRLVKGMDARHTLDRVIDHIRSQGFFVVDREPTAAVRQAHPKVAQVTPVRVGLGSARTPMDLPISQEVVRTVDSVRGPAVKLPTMGGSLPLAEIEQPLHTRTIVIPIANHDNHQHSANENLRIQNLWDGIELMAALLTM